MTQAGLESEFAGIPVVCSREPQTFQIRVPASLDGAFTKGKARLLAYVLLEDEAAGDMHSVSPTRKIVIHKR